MGKNDGLRALDLAEHVGRDAVGAGDGAVGYALGSAGLILGVLGEPGRPPALGFWNNLARNLLSLSLLPQLLPQFEVLRQLRPQAR